MGKFTVTQEEFDKLPESVHEKFTQVEAEDEDAPVTFEFDGDPTDLIEDTSGLKKAYEHTKEDKKLLAKAAKKSAEADIVLASTKHSGNVHLLPKVIRDEMEWSNAHGAYIKRAEDGEPMMNENGELYTVEDHIAFIKTQDEYGSLFRGTNHSGTGTPPGDHGGGGGSRGSDASGLPKAGTKRSSMSREQIVAILREKGEEGLQEYPI